MAVQQGPHGTIDARQSSSTQPGLGPRAAAARARALQTLGATIARMLEDLEALRAKLTELHARVRMLREENMRLRAQAGAAQIELDALRRRCAGAVQRVDELLARLPEAQAEERASPAR